ncbi:Mitochondrial outer membrane protein iml2 [Microbotryomycetes sp. JL201]|nr:Mitochondrial outer membrane protein iml2 [Microbotryomycetes sp. JL201]
MSSGSLADRPNLLDLVQNATIGFEQLLNNDLAGAKRNFESRQHDSVPHAVGMGLSLFLSAALGAESDALAAAMEALQKAEALANHGDKTRSQAEQDTSRIYPALEYKILTNDAVLGQALCHLLTESYLEFLQVPFKMSRAYKGFKQIYQIVFPGGADGDLDSIFRTLNEDYTRKLQGNDTSEKSTSGSFFGWGRKKSTAAVLRPSASSAALPSLRNLQLNDKPQSASEPVSTNGTPNDSSTDLVAPQKNELGHPAPLWANDPLTTIVISGCAFGFGLFGLILSLLPPRTRKLISWFGFSNSDRATALKLLTVSASTGNDVHGYFASLALLTFYCVILLMSGWQANEQYLLTQCNNVLSRVIDRFPKGTLWRLNKAKLHRMRHETDAAIQVAEDALSHESSFREADSLLLGWLYLSNAQYVKSADAFEKMCSLNSWSHSTYLAIAAGCLIDLPMKERTIEITQRIHGLLDKLPTLFGQKRLFGEPPTTEIFIARRLAADKAKHERWIAAGRLSRDSHVSEVMKITYAYILGCFWATIGGRSPPEAIRAQIQHLAEMTPPMTGAVQAEPNPAADELDSVEEYAMRALLLGALYRSQNTGESLATAKRLLQFVLDNKQQIQQEKWTVPFSMFELAVIECKSADLEEQAANHLPLQQRNAMWTGRLKRADSLLQDLLKIAEYDLKSRLESRVMMLREEIATKQRELHI